MGKVDERLLGEEEVSRIVRRLETLQDESERGAFINHLATAIRAREALALEEVPELALEVLVTRRTTQLLPLPNYYAVRSFLPEAVETALADFNEEAAPYVEVLRRSC